MNEPTCANCGATHVPLHSHHVFGRTVSDVTVNLCPNCHDQHHKKGLMLVRNKAAEAAMKEVNELEEHRFVGLNEIQTILEKHGYKPVFDPKE